MASDQAASANVIVAALEQTLARLLRQPQTRGNKALVLEARRLLRIVANWSAVPPTPEGRREMLARVMTLAASRDMEPSVPPSDPVRSVEPSSAPRSRPSAVPPPFRTEPAPSSQRRVAPGVELVEAESMAWEPLQNDSGVWVKTLRRDRGSGVYTSLVRLEPGAQLARHRHHASGEMFLLEGSAHIGSVEVRAGYFAYAVAGAVHEIVESRDGCVMLLVGSDSDELLP